MTGGRGHSGAARALFGRWLLACTAGELLGIGAAAGVALTVAAALGEPGSLGGRLLVLLAMVLAGVLEGTLVGGFQWRVLRRRFPHVRARAWVGATVAVAALGWFVGMLPPTFFMGPEAGARPASEPGLAQVAVLAAGFGLVAGAAFGGGQWWVLRRHAARAGWWVAANALGWAVGMPCIFLAASLPEAGTARALTVLLGAAGGVLAGFCVAVPTGAVLVRLRPLPG